MYHETEILVEKNRIFEGSKIKLSSRIHYSMGIGTCHRIYLGERLVGIQYRSVGSTPTEITCTAIFSFKAHA